ncbi:MAG TPA: hypothetical protein VFU15_10755 [Bacteroidia bacterium]|nr:hypothetical protein [Bacteroidia bacterium]
MKSKQEESPGADPDIPVYLKIGPHFILPSLIRSVSRFGKGTKIIFASGNEVVVNVKYEKVAEVMKGSG